MTGPRRIPTFVSKNKPQYVKPDITTIRNRFLLEAEGRETLSEKSTFGDKPCAVCGDPGTICCEQCRETEVGQLGVFYCSTNCLEADRQNHSRVCQTTKNVTRAAVFLDKVWFLFEKTTFSSAVEVIKEVNNVTHVKYVWEDVNRRGWTGQDVFRKFPQDVFPVCQQDESIQQGTLYYKYDSELRTTAKPLLEFFLNDVDMAPPILDAITVIPKKPAHTYRTLAGPVAQSDAKHTVIGVTLVTGNPLMPRVPGGSFIIDIARSIHGWKELVYYSSAYQKHRMGVSKMTVAQDGQNAGDEQINFDSVALGFVSTLEKKVLAMYPEHSRGRAHQKFRHEIMEAMMVMIDDFFKDRNLTVADFLALPRRRYASTSHALLFKIAKFLSDAVEALIASGRSRMYFCPEANTMLVAMTREKYLEVRRGFLTEAEYEANKGNVEALKALRAKKMAEPVPAPRRT